MADRRRREDDDRGPRDRQSQVGARDASRDDKGLCDVYDRQSAEIVWRWLALPAARWDGTLDFFGSKRPASPMAWSFLFDIVHRPGPDHDVLAPDGINRAASYGPSADEP